MKNLLIFIALALLCFSVDAYEITFDGAQIKHNKGKFSIWPKDAKDKFGYLELSEEDVQQLPIEIKNGELVVDTRAYYKKYKTGKTLMIRKPSDIPNG